MSTEDNADLFPSTSRDVFNSMDRSYASSEFDKEMLVEVEARMCTEEAAPKN